MANIMTSAKAKSSDILDQLHKETKTKLRSILDSIKKCSLDFSNKYSKDEQKEIKKFFEDKLENFDLKNDISSGNDILELLSSDYKKRFKSIGLDWDSFIKKLQSSEKAKAKLIEYCLENNGQNIGHIYNFFTQKEFIDFGFNKDIVTGILNHVYADSRCGDFYENYENLTSEYLEEVINNIIKHKLDKIISYYGKTFIKDHIEQFIKEHSKQFIKNHMEQFKKEHGKPFVEKHGRKCLREHIGQFMEDHHEEFKEEYDNTFYEKYVKDYEWLGSAIRQLEEFSKFCTEIFGKEKGEIKEAIKESIEKYTEIRDLLMDCKM